MSGALPLLIVALLTPSVDPCGARTDLRAKALTVQDAAALWQIEAALADLPPCVESSAPSAVATPARVEAPVDLPAQPSGPGAGPWVLLGVSAALLGGLIYVDGAADGPRDDLAAASAAGDRAAFEAAEDDFAVYQWVGRGLAAGAAVAGVSGLLWLAFGGEDDPVQSRPVFGPLPGGASVGWGATF
ncbi:MAG: hypothetical protein H6704_03450 [Myxococcales bacterium]|nr:hypothetical protein [Myxococcales bacterium]